MIPELIAAKMHKKPDGIAHFHSGYSRAVTTSASKLDSCASLRPTLRPIEGGAS